MVYPLSNPPLGVRRPLDGCHSAKLSPFLALYETNYRTSAPCSLLAVKLASRLDHTAADTIALP